MPIVRIQHSFQGASGIPRDQYVNTFHMLMASYDSGDLATVAGYIKNFYNATQPSSFAIGDFLAGQADSAPGGRIKMYDLSDPEPRAIIYQETYTPPNLFGSSMVPLPSEVALCLSYSGIPLEGVPVARTRGRIYIGPLSTKCIPAGGSTDGLAQPSLSVRETLTTAGQQLAQDMLGIVDPLCAWVVYSPTAGTTSGIAKLWCDNEFDTQRRRGNKATARTSIDV